MSQEKRDETNKKRQEAYQKRNEKQLQIKKMVVDHRCLCLIIQVLLLLILVCDVLCQSLQPMRMQQTRKI
jgi:hypothetical protein